MVTPFSWESFQKNRPQDAVKEIATGESSKMAQEDKKDFSWGNFQNTSTYQGEIDPTQDESSFGVLSRNAISNLARFSEAYLGKYGDIEKAGRTILKNPSSLGILGKSLSLLMGKENWERLFTGQILPTSEDMKKLTYAATGEYTKPKTKMEKRVQAVSSDVGSVSTRGASLINNVGIPAAANAAKEVVSELKFGETSAEWTKLAAWTGLSLINNVNAAAYAAQLMNEGRNAFGANVAANVPRYETSLNRVARNMLQADPRSSLAQQQISGIRNDIQEGQTSMGDLMNRYDAINAAKRDSGLFALRREDRIAAIRNINMVRDAVREEITHLGAINPPGLQSWENGVQAFSVIHQSRAISNFVDRSLSSRLAKTAVGALFGAGAFKSPLIVGTASAAAPAAYKIGQVAYRVWENPTLARYYWDSLNAARQMNQAEFLKSFNKLNDLYEKKYGQRSEEPPIQ